MTPDDIAETVYIRLSQTDDRGEHIRIIAGALAKERDRCMRAIDAAKPVGGDWPIGRLCGMDDAIIAIRALGESE